MVGKPSLDINLPVLSFWYNQPEMTPYIKKRGQSRYDQDGVVAVVHFLRSICRSLRSGTNYVFLW